MTKTSSSPTSLGAFSVSLSVSDLGASQAFYEKLGFVTAGGDAAQNWLILRNGSVTLGLFQGMFEKNMLTFNPGWDGEAKPLESFEDVRALQRRWTEAGLSFASRIEDEEGSGPA
ncbi:MAG: VOC family protein, partial [Myxococcota bacterium]